MNKYQLVNGKWIVTKTAQTSQTKPLNFCRRESGKTYNT